MKDAILTIRLSKATRRRLEALAKAEDRSLSQQVVRLVEQGLAAPASVAESTKAYGPRSLEGVLRGQAVTTLDDWRRTRRELSASLLGRMDRDDQLRR